jgi:hypothetical protein
LRESLEARTIARRPVVPTENLVPATSFGLDDDRTVVDGWKGAS